MPFDFSRARPLLQDCSLKKLFVEELGWEPFRQELTFLAGDYDYTLSGIAEKRGFTGWLCEGPDGGVPEHNTRLKLDRELAQISYEHLIVFVTIDRSRQSWMWVRREPGRPLSVRTHEYTRGQPGDSLLQKLQLLYVSLEEEEAGLSVTGVSGRVRAAFDVDRVTKRFYREFDSQRKAFLKFVNGIEDQADQEWYASVMLNRLMFVYFIQRKGFLDGDPHYLRNRLNRTVAEHGKDKFYSFYRYFLLRLFHEGLGDKNRTPDLEKLLGRIPYLNGGMFDIHELEKPERYGEKIKIPDEAFERIFDYFDQYQWHLDERPLRADNEINPDVLGYIFEKYINQKQMGAYYTKEDITEYISKNTIIPFLFDAASAKCKIAFDNPNGPTVWDLLRENPDRYIYPSVRHGITWNMHSGKPLGKPVELPEEIAQRLNPPTLHLPVSDGPVLTLELRKNWNRPAAAEFALPTEIWREVVARRNRYDRVRAKLATGEVRDINDLITYNLDIRQFAQDVIENCEGPEMLRAFWHTIEKITILDPTCGSGAFLFAALKILEPLYEACLDRMEAFVTDLERSVQKHRPEKFSDFRKVLERLAAHPNRSYFILKSIILNNLYGVDIMEEAVEICKLRLFLKLGAQVEPDTGKENMGIEPLPDVDFNIRAGNTLVGYATYDQVEKAVTSKLDFTGTMKNISVKAADLQQTFNAFRRRQTEGDGSVPVEHKLEMNKRLESLEDELNSYLAAEYNVSDCDSDEYAGWLKSYQPFHWFIEYYSIMQSGGFDVIIGNPPYLFLRQLDSYTPRNYETLPTNNLYSLVLERGEELIKGRQGYIVPISSTATEGYAEVQQILRKRELWFVSFDDRPAHLFDGLDKNTLSILLLSRKQTKLSMVSSRLNRWSAEERHFLFPRLQLHRTPRCLLPGCLPRIGSKIEFGIWEKIFSHTGALASARSVFGKATTYYSRKVNAFLQILDFVPKVRDGRGQLRPPSEFKALTFAESSHSVAVFCLLNSTLFRWFVDVVSDGSHLNRREIDNFPFSPILASVFTEQFTRFAKRLSDDLEKNSFERRMTYSHDTLTVQCIIPKFSKPIIDDIDTVLALHYGFTEEELDFIINYDIKYRMGRDSSDEEEA